MTLTVVSQSLAPTAITPLERAIFETLAYSDIFDYPLMLIELRRYLSLSISLDELKSQIPLINSLPNRDGYYHLPGRDEIVAIRKGRNSASRRDFHRALSNGKILAHIPFVRMVAMTGSLAVLNLSKNADMDFMLVTAPHRLWIARAFAVTFGRLMRLTGDRICVNLLVSERALEWPRHDLYSAREMAQMIPIAGLNMYHKLRESNPWVATILPNASDLPDHSPPKPDETGSWIQHFLELLFPGKFGAWLDDLLMKIQLRKINRKYGHSAEANFNVHVCQGNFHDHRAWADEFFRARLVSLGLESGDGSTQ
ncbi:MAG: hypothetical protein EDM79_02260 [Chloroflexi bacterium]|nr:MAG: hypothetical protein EDM79_02260 [Chloroflexota bacterium]